MELAKMEAVKGGDKLQDYEIKIVNDTNMNAWSFFFEAKALGPNVRPALGKDFIITVDKKTGHTVLMPGE
ncbi:MAG: hypothetical protein ABSD77_07935 [Verrucomicrobiota bacterium]|jgi:hypothetical protein